MDLGKDLVAASATPLVLAILAEGDSYGYAIIKRVKRAVGRAPAVDRRHALPGVAPTRAAASCAAKWGASESGRRRKYYRITKEGRAQLAVQREQWQVVDRHCTASG